MREPIFAPMLERFCVRPDSSGFSVFDRLTGEFAVIAMATQGVLSQADAERTAMALNRRDADHEAASLR